MPKVEYDPTTNSWSLGPTESDLHQVAKALEWLFRREQYIDYSPDRAAEAYQDSNIQLVQTPDGRVRAPYQLLVDYRRWPARQAWGTIAFAEAYSFPGALANHKTAMIHQFERQKLLKKGNQMAPRVMRCELQRKVPHFVLQSAYYYDQVGSNLTLDFPFAAPIPVGAVECRCVREWDVAQAHGKVKQLPEFEESKLANTVGVAIGMTAKSRDGHLHWLRRKRSKTVAVYPGMWHVPFSFALAIDEHSRSVKDIRSLIRFDLANERAEELGGLDYSDFGELRPVALCRDLARGGKPQFFLELPCLVPFEDLRRKAVDTTSEFAGKIESISDGEEEMFSPELACFMLLKLLLEQDHAD